jgi:hypothetical protein
MIKIHELIAVFLATGISQCQDQLDKFVLHYTSSIHHPKRTGMVSEIPADSKNEK